MQLYRQPQRQLQRQTQRTDTPTENTAETGSDSYRGNREQHQDSCIVTLRYAVLQAGAHARMRARPLTVDSSPQFAAQRPQTGNQGPWALNSQISTRTQTRTHALSPYNLARHEPRLWIARLHSKTAGHTVNSGPRVCHMPWFWT